ncbi:3-hydroxybutyrate dehydrogenase [Blastococcus sp. Marseille-P5729]|uniref:3-hydroxybutyrate dehydrogenase n=1 Tax=Blastococcus sp. Marseille-P5729 TaxID=2086582 RepID=UPI000D0F1C3C|nr:3-hydroxybutyrate dehydrogenase [Blastococcus sp. Marseille-P5729]
MSDQPLINLDLSGRSALVTGGVSGIGLACAQRLAQAGAELVVVDLDENAAREVAEPLGGRGIGADLTDPAVLDAIDAETYAADIIVNNAGFQRVAPIEDFPPEVFVAIQKVMVEAPFRLVRAALPRMYEKGWGRVINISSAHGLIASPYKVAYVTAKHGLEGFSKVVAMEGAAHGVTSNCINPGYVRTPLVEKQIADQATTHGIGEDEVIEKIMLQRPAIKRLLEPAEVAELAIYLCSPVADCITGSSYRLDGGWVSN